MGHMGMGGSSETALVRASAAALQLLPPEDQRLPCAEFSASLELAPGGTGLAVDAIVVIETPLPWPKPVFAHPLLTGVAGKITAFGGPVRVLAAVPRDPLRRRVFVWRRTPDGAEATAHDPTDIAEFLDALQSDRPPAGTPIDPRAVLICTQGSHDQCCGTFGERVASEVSQLADVPVFRVSHTGGHRFAPTGMTFPDGRMWAFASPDDFMAAQAGRGDAAQLAAKCRGWWGAATGAAQAGEAAVFGHVGFALNAQERSVTVRSAHPKPEESAGPDVGPWLVDVVTDTHTWQVEVSVPRMVPTIACESAGGLPAKPAREFVAGTVTNT